MTAKTNLAKRRAFLRAFAATGNQTLAAERAGMSRWTVRDLRRAGAQFDSQWRAAKSASARRLAAGCNRQPPEWKHKDGVALVVQRAGEKAAAGGAQPSDSVDSAGRGTVSRQAQAI